MIAPSESLPTDLAAAHAMILEQRGLLIAAQARADLAESERTCFRLEVERLKLLLAKARRAQFGQTSERGRQLVEQLELAIADLEETQAEVEAQTEIATPAPAARRAIDARKPARRPLPDHLPRERVMYPAPCICGKCGGARLRKLGEIVTETLECEPRRWKVVQHVRETMTCRDCESITETPARGLGDVVAAGPTTSGPARRPADPLQAGRRDTPPTVLESVREMRADVLDLRSAAVPETGVGATVDATFEPLLQAVLRPASATWHGRPDLAASAATAAETRIGELRDSVRVLTPPSPYSLGTSDAPLLLGIANGLPVTMEVRLSISSTTGLRVAPIPPQRIPPLGRRQVQVSAEVVRSGQFSVEATVHSPAGRALGPPSRLQVRSTAYGTITVWLTGSAAVLLVVLAAHRVVRRVRGESSPRDRTGPSVGPPTPETPTPETPTPETPRPEPEGAAPALLTDLPTAPVRASNPEPPTTPVRTPPDPEPPTRPVPARRP